MEYPYGQISPQIRTIPKMFCTTQDMNLLGVKDVLSLKKLF